MCVSMYVGLYVCQFVCQFVSGLGFLFMSFSVSSLCMCCVSLLKCVSYVVECESMCACVSVFSVLWVVCVYLTVFLCVAVFVWLFECVSIFLLFILLSIKPQVCHLKFLFRSDTVYFQVFSPPPGIPVVRSFRFL